MIKEYLLIIKNIQFLLSNLYRQVFKILITKLNINNSKNLNNFFEIFNNLKFIDLFEKIKPISKKYFKNEI